MKKTIYIYLLLLLLLLLPIGGHAQIIGRDPIVYISQVFFGIPENSNGGLVSTFGIADDIEVENPSSNTGQFIELYNAGATPANIGGWVLEIGKLLSYTIPSGTVIAPNSTLLVAYRESGASYLLSQKFKELSLRERGGSILYQSVFSLSSDRWSTIQLLNSDLGTADVFECSMAMQLAVNIFGWATINPGLLANNRVLSVTRTGKYKNSIPEIYASWDGDIQIIICEWSWNNENGGVINPDPEPQDPEIPAVNFESRVAESSQNMNYIYTSTLLNEEGTKYLDRIQYFDDLGYPLQTIHKRVSPAGNDLVNYQEYDAWRRESKSWLPISKENNQGKFINITNFSSSANSTYNDLVPYAKPAYESSPLSRITEVHDPGYDWRNNPQSTNYRVNSSDDPCFYYTIEGEAVKNNGYYPDGSLIVIEKLDEDKKGVIEFYDKLGNLILQRQKYRNESADTYYVYDLQNQLRIVLPPMASDIFTQIGKSYAFGLGFTRFYAFLYEYDAKGRCVKKRLPGADPVAFMYDAGDQLVCSQNGEQTKSGQWAFEIPDKLGRIALKGTCKNPNFSESEVVYAQYTGSSLYGYEYFNFNADEIVILEAFYYDDYHFRSHINKTSGFNYTVVDDFEDKRFGNDSDLIKSKGLLTGTITALLDDPENQLGTVYYYDSKGRCIQTISSNHMGGYNKEYINYSFSGKPIWRYLDHTTSTLSLIVESTRIKENYTYEYDHADRLTKTYYKINEQDERLLSELVYDELGRVAIQKLYDGTEDVSYGYNIRNQLTSISSTNFNQELFYTNPHYGSTKSYNGNVSSTKWKRSGRSYTFGYQYTYDNFNRLKRAAFLTGSTLNNYFSESMTYDKNGNILTLNRNAYQNTIDALSLTYSGNQLSSISDAAPALYATEGFVSGTHSQPFAYDKNGSLTQDYYRGISGIQYNLLNLPEKIQFMYGHSTQYSYDATGAKRRVVHTTVKNNLNVPLGNASYEPSSESVENTLTTDYCGNIIYENRKVKYVMTPVGYITVETEKLAEVDPGESGLNPFDPDEGGFDPPGGGIIKLSSALRTYYHHHYYLKDYQGSNRAVIKVTDSGSEVMQEVNYYPFGMPHPLKGDDFYGKGYEQQSYKREGKEYDEMHGLNWYDQGARFFGSDLPISPTQDPLAEKYYHISPYAQWANNPVYYIDPDGLSVHLNRLGYIVQENDDGDEGVYTHNNLSNWDSESVLGKSGKGINYIGDLGRTINIDDIYTNLIEYNIPIAKSIWSPFTFIKLVKTNGEWDLKNNKSTIYSRGERDGRTKYSFGGGIMESQDIGNHHFGIVAKASNLFSNEKNILKGAGIYQMISGKSKKEWQVYKRRAIMTPFGPRTITELSPPYGDDPRDQMWIKLGFGYYKKNKK